MEGGMHGYCTHVAHLCVAEQASVRARAFAYAKPSRPDDGCQTNIMCAGETCAHGARCARKDVVQPEHRRIAHCWRACVCLAENIPYTYYTLYGYTVSIQYNTHRETKDDTAVFPQSCRSIFHVYCLTDKTCQTQSILYTIRYKTAHCHSASVLIYEQTTTSSGDYVALLFSRTGVHSVQVTPVQMGGRDLIRVPDIRRRRRRRRWCILSRNRCR